MAKVLAGGFANLINTPRQYAPLATPTALLATMGTQSLPMTPYSTQTVQFIATDDLSSVDPATFTYELQNDF